MSEIQQLLNAYNALEDEMKQFDTLASKVLAGIRAQEFVSEKINTDMMQCIMELNKKQKEVFKIYKKANLGDAAPKKMRDMRDQIEAGLEEQKKLDYLEAVRNSFLSLYTEDKEVDKALQTFKDKVKTITVEKYALDKCLVYIRPFAVFLTVIKFNDPEKTVELVPILMDYFGSKLVAHVTMSKDIYIGEDATEFTMEEQIPEDSADQAELPEDETDSEEIAQDSKEIDQKEDSEETEDLQEVVENEASQEEAEVFNLLESDVEKQEEEDEKFAQYLEETKKAEEAEKDMLKGDVGPTELDPDELGTIELEPMEPELKDIPPANIVSSEKPEESTKPAKPKKPKKVDLKALLEEDNFSESKLDDPELKEMNDGKKKRKKGSKDSGFLNPKGIGTIGGF